MSLIVLVMLLPLASSQSPKSRAVWLPSVAFRAGSSTHSKKSLWKTSGMRLDGGGGVCVS